MSQRWLAVVLLVACGSQREDRSPEVEREAVERARKSLEVARDELRAPPPMQDLSNRRPPPPPPDPAPRTVPVQPVQPAPPASCLSSGTVVSFEAGATLRACIDSTFDGAADRCVRWRPNGTLIGIDPLVDVEAKEEPPELVTYHSDSEHNDDSRIELSGGVIDICPYDRACMKLMPRLDDREIQHVVTDAEYNRAAIVVREADGKQGYVELWDLDRGRRYAKAPFRGLVRDQGYSFSVKLGSGAFIALAERDGDGAISGAIHGLDGGYRGALGGGSHTLDATRTLQAGGQFAIVDPQTDDKPYLLHVHDLATGGATGRFVIARDEDATDGLQLHKLTPGIIGAAQWGKQLRLDVIDLRTRTARVLRAPAC